MRERTNIRWFVRDSFRREGKEKEISSIFFSNGLEPLTSLFGSRLESSILAEEDIKTDLMKRGLNCFSFEEDGKHATPVRQRREESSRRRRSSSFDDRSVMEKESKSHSKTNHRATDRQLRGLWKDPHEGCGYYPPRHKWIPFPIFAYSVKPYWSLPTVLLLKVTTNQELGFSFVPWR